MILKKLFILLYPPLPLSANTQAILLNKLLHDLTAPSEFPPLHYEFFSLVCFAIALFTPLLPSLRK